MGLLYFVILMQIVFGLFTPKKKKIDKEEQFCYSDKTNRKERE